MTTHYTTLGIGRKATPEEIRLAYLKLARKWHPDKNKSIDATEKFQEIQSAFGVLSDSENRRIYEATLGPIPMEKPMPSPYTPSSPKPEEELHPEKLPQDLVDVIDSDEPVLFQPYLRNYSEQQLGAVLIKACRMGKRNIAQAMIKKHPSLLQLDISVYYPGEIEGKCSLLFPAVLSDNSQLLNDLLHGGLKAYERVKKYCGSDNVTPLDLAVKNNQILVCTVLLMDTDFKKLSKKNPGLTAQSFLLPAFQNGNAKLCNVLFRYDCLPEDPIPFLRLCIEKRDYPLVKDLCYYLDYRFNGQRFSGAAVAIASFGFEKIGALIASKELDPFSRMLKEDYFDRAYLYRLCRSIGLSCDIRILDLLIENFAELRDSIKSKELQKLILFGALEEGFLAISPISKKDRFKFCISFLKRYGVPARLDQMPEVVQMARKRGSRFIDLLEGFAAE